MTIYPCKASGEMLPARHSFHRQREDDLDKHEEITVCDVLDYVREAF